MKKFVGILSFYTCVPKITIIWCTVPDIQSGTDSMFCHFGPFFASPFFALLPPYGPRKSKFWKNEKNTWRYYHFTNVYHKWQSYDVWFLRCEVQRRDFLSFWTIFCPFTLLSTRKIKILINWKKHLDILLFYICVSKMTTMWCVVPEIWSMTDRIFLSFWTIFSPFYLPP